MSLSGGERIEMVAGSARCGHIVGEFNRKQREHAPIKESVMAKVTARFKETGSVSDKRRSGRCHKRDSCKRTVKLFVFINHPVLSFNF